MGFLSKIKDIGKTLVTKPLESFKEGAKAVSAITAAPVTTIKSGLTAGQTQVKQQGILTSSIKSVATLGTIASVVVGGGAILSNTTAKSIISKAAPIATKAITKITPTTPKGIITAGVVSIPVAAAIIAQPTKTISAALSIPSNLASFGTDVSNFAVNPSMEGAKQIVSESPIISAGAGLLLVGGAAKAVAPIVSGYLTREAIDDQTAILEKSLSDKTTTTKTPETNAPIVSTTPTTKTFENPSASQLPVTPQTKTITAGATKTTRKRRRKARQSNNFISQRVSVLVNNANKKYINKGVLVA